MNRQTLARREKVLGAEHPDTLTSMYCLAHLLGSRHCYDESTALYERACAGYNATLRKDHPTARACHRHYSQMLSSQTQGPPDVPPEVVPGGVGKRKGKGSRLLGAFAKIGVRISKDHK
jgi:hypothetical protein